VVGEVREYDELADIYQKLDTVRIPTSLALEPGTRFDSPSEMHPENQIILYMNSIEFDLIYLVFIFI
jgi:hypothetical protein